MAKEAVNNQLANILRLSKKSLKNWDQRDNSEVLEY